MQRTPRNKQGKQPLRPKRGPDGRWLAPPPDPEPPDKQGAEKVAHLHKVTDDMPVTGGGLVIGRPTPSPRPPSPIVSTQIVVRPATDNDEEVVRRARPPSAVVATYRPSSRERPPTRKRVRLLKLTDEEAGPPAPTSRHHMRYGPSPESEQQDSVLGNPIAQVTAQDAFHRNTQLHSVTSFTPPVSTPKFSRNTQSIQRVMRGHAERVEARAQSAYEQNRAALDHITKSMDSVRSAFTEAKRTRDRFHNLLSVSSQSRQNARRRTEADAPSRHLRSQVLDSEERRDVRPSVVSAWRLRSGMYPASSSRRVEGENVSMDLVTRVSTTQFTALDARRMRLREWVTEQRLITLQRLAREECDPVRQRGASPVARADSTLARHSTAPPAPKRTAGELVDWLDPPPFSRPLARDSLPHQQPSTTRRMASDAPGESPWESSLSSASVQTARSPRTSQTPRHKGLPRSPSRDGSRVPEYLRSHRAPTFEPVTPGEGPTPAHSHNLQLPWLGRMERGLQKIPLLARCPSQVRMHHARDCPPENRKAARGYAMRIVEEDTPAPVNDSDSEYHSAESTPDDRNAQSPEHDSPSSDDECGDHPEGEKYNTDEVYVHTFSSSDNSEPVYSRAPRIIATSVLNTVESRAAKAAKPLLLKVPNVERNQARYKIGKGPQPQRDNQLQHCVEVLVPMKGLPARVLLDVESNTNTLSPKFAAVAKVWAIELHEQMTFQLAVTGSGSKVNHSTWVPMEFGPVKAFTYFDIANTDGYDVILGTPFLLEYGASPIYDDNGWAMRNGKCIHSPFQPPSTSKSSQSFQNSCD
jgi:hypothetical protein